MGKRTFLQKFEAPSLTVRIITSGVFGTLVSFLLFYIFLPAINLSSSGFWIYLTASLFFYILPFLNLGELKSGIKARVQKKKYKDKTGISKNEILALCILLPIVISIVGTVISAPIFNSRKYAAIIDVSEYDFAADMPESTEITNIALMDTDSATVLGNRTLGSLSDMVSQYTVSDYYTQINFNNTPKKVSPLEYDGFFKWLGNRENGIPGMVMVDPVKNDAEYVAFKETTYYAESAYFGDDLERRLRFQYPTKIFGSISFETDDNSDPYYIISCVKPRVMMFGAMDVSEVIIFNPTSGKGEIMAVSDVPSWVDIVYTGERACEKYNWHGTLAGGYMNSIIGNKGCKMATDDFGYVVIDDDVWYFTGVTSVVSNDKSNIGFILTNARTGEYKFYPVIGAEEHSAMAAAQGEVQEKGYVASFPSLVNISNQPTYIMVLKDAVGVVKLYALVNVQNYSIVATGATQTEAMTAYKKLLRQNGVGTDEAVQTVDITVENVRLTSLGGVATVYITATDGAVYKGYLETDEALILVRAGDKLSLSYAKTENERIFVINEWSFAK